MAAIEEAVEGLEVSGIYTLNPHDDDILTYDPIMEELPSSKSINIKAMSDDYSRIHP